MIIEPQFVEKGAFTLVGMGITTKPMAGEIAALWQTFAPRIHEVASIAEPMVSYGVIEDFDAVHFTLQYTAAVSVSDTRNIPGQMTTLAIGPNTYAVFKATLGTLGDVFGFIFNSWMPNSGFEMVKAPHFERYGASFNPAVPGSEIEIYIPVRTRST